MTAIPDTLASLVVPLDSVRPYGDNPREGDVGAICVSLERNGQYRPIVVNKRDGQILAGNHTWKAAAQLGWDGIAATFVDVDAETARRIVLVDNRSNDLAAYDDSVLAALLESIVEEHGVGLATAPDPRIFGDGIARLAREVSLRLEMGVKARLVAEQHLRWEKSVDAVENLYRKLMRDRGRDPGV